jgi:endoglucanase
VRSLSSCHVMLRSQYPHSGLGRRQMIEALAVAASSLSACRRVSEPTAKWRGFNLQEKFTDRPDEWLAIDPEWGRSNEPFVETDFAWIAELGFNFVRLPMSYRCWANPASPFELLERPLREIDQAVSWGQQYGIHVCLNFHRAPGFCINAALAPEPWSLWKDQIALDAFIFHWSHFASRYKGIPNTCLSFNLLNEPNGCTPNQYARVILQSVNAIREVDANRLVIVDGMFGELMQPVPELSTLDTAIHSTRGYAPFSLTHYLAPWAGAPAIVPTWPVRSGDLDIWDKDRLDEFGILPWQGFETRGARVFVGEWGCWNRTPHDVALAWMRDHLDLWRKAGWGWALWCFRGSFGLLDSNRPDVSYENWRGHLLDREMLELLQR